MSYSTFGSHVLKHILDIHFFVIVIFCACHRQLAARIQGNQDDNGDKDSKHIKRSFKAELRDALTVVSKRYHF